VGSAGGHKSPLAINYVRAQAATIDFLQAANQVLQILDCADHSQKTSAVHDRRADQHDGVGGLAAADYQRLSVINAAFARGSIGAFEFTLQEGIRRNSSRRNSFGFGVEQGGVGQVLRRRNEIFQQGAQFGGFDMF